MRDAHRMKEKLDLSLDHRQVVGLLTGGLVVLGAVFVLGVVVGKRLAAPVGPADSAYLLSSLDGKTQALEKVRQSPLLTFQEELTRKGVDPVVPDAGHLAVPPPLAPVVPKPAPEVAAEASPGTVKVAAHAPDEKPASAEKLKDAIARVEKPAPQTAVTTTGVTSPSSGHFTLQLAATPTRTEADRHVGKLKDRGYSPYVISAEVPGKGTWYRVRMGNFASKEAAQKFLADFKRETQMDAFVANVP